MEADLGGARGGQTQRHQGHSGERCRLGGISGGKLPFPDGAIIARLSWNYVPSEENDNVFGQPQSFVASGQPDWYLQFMVKDSKKYASTGGWGYAQFDKDGKPAGEAKHRTCYPCHVPVQDRDYVFTRYAP